AHSFSSASRSPFLGYVLAALFELDLKFSGSHSRCGGYPFRRLLCRPPGTTPGDPDAALPRRLLAPLALRLADANLVGDDALSLSTALPSWRFRAPDWAGSAQRNRRRARTTLCVPLVVCALSRRRVRLSDEQNHWNGKRCHLAIALPCLAQREVSGLGQ